MDNDTVLYEVKRANGVDHAEPARGDERHQRGHASCA